MFSSNTRVCMQRTFHFHAQLGRSLLSAKRSPSRTHLVESSTRALRRSVVFVVNAAVKSGSALADFPEYFQKVKASNGRDVTLSSFKNRKPVVLFFYPKAGTPGCTKQAQKFRDEYNRVKKLGAEVFGISGDTLEEQKNFVQAQNLPFPLLVDENNALRKGFGVPSDLFGALPGRQTIVIDKKGNCILSYNNQLNPESHVEQAIKALSS